MLYNYNQLLIPDTVVVRSLEKYRNGEEERKDIVVSFSDSTYVKIVLNPSEYGRFSVECYLKRKM
jgi:hypothetical protein